MAIINPLKSWNLKQNDKLILEVRLGKFTVLKISYDISEKEFDLNLLSLLIINKKFINY